MPTRWAAPLKPIQIPYLFFFLDTERTFEIGLTLLYEEKLVRYSGDILDVNSVDYNNDDAQIMVQVFGLNWPPEDCERNVVALLLKLPLLSLFFQLSVEVVLRHIEVARHQLSEYL